MTRPDLPTHGRLLGLDYGTKRVGIAVSDQDQRIASPLKNYQRQTPEIDARFLNGTVRDYRVVGLLVGLPVHLSGEEGQKAREAREFGTWVADVTGLPVQFWDERYTSSVAESYLLAVDMSRKKRKQYRDKIAAQILLQSFLDAEDRNQTPQPM